MENHSRHQEVLLIYVTRTNRQEVKTVCERKINRDDYEEDINDLRDSDESIVRCPTCGRKMYQVHKIDGAYGNPLRYLGWECSECD